MATRVQPVRREADAAPERGRGAAPPAGQAGEIPSISTLVDIGNLASIRHAVPVAFFDRDGLDGGLTVRFADGSEPFTDLGATEASHPEPGEVVFVDRSGVVNARRWCWRQSAQSATRETTTDALIVIEAQHGGAADDVIAAASDIATLLERYQPASRAEPLALAS